MILEKSAGLIKLLIDICNHSEQIALSKIKFCQVYLDQKELIYMIFMHCFLNVKKTNL